MDLTSGLVASAYSGVSSFPNLLAAVCTANGETVSCSNLIPAGLLPFIFVLWGLVLILGIISLIACWIIFQKAGKPGWAAIIPIYNIIVLLEIIEKPVWWIVFCFIPGLNGLFGLVLTYFLAKSFGKSDGFAIGMILLPFIFYPTLAFGSSTYQGGESSSGDVPPNPYPPASSNPSYTPAPQQNSAYSPASYQQSASASQFVDYSHKAPQNPPQQPQAPTPPPQPQTQNPSTPQNPQSPQVPPIPPVSQ